MSACGNKVVVVVLKLKPVICVEKELLKQTCKENQN